MQVKASRGNHDGSSNTIFVPTCRITFLEMKSSPSSIGQSTIGEGSQDTLQGLVTSLGWNNSHYLMFRPYLRYGSMCYIASGVTLIHPPSNFLHINTELSHVYLLAWLSYVYLPLCSGKASTTRPHHLLPLPGEIPHKLGKVLLLFLDLLSGTCPMLPSCCSSIPKGMLDNVKHFVIFS